MKRCRNCLVPGAVPGVVLSADGLCNLCTSTARQSSAPADEDARKEREADLERALAEARRHGSAYDCMVALSGGKDSIYLLSQAEGRLRPARCWRSRSMSTSRRSRGQNIRRTVAKLDVDHLIYRPLARLLRKLFRYLLAIRRSAAPSTRFPTSMRRCSKATRSGWRWRRASRWCWPATRPASPKPERMLYEFSRKLICETDWTPPELTRCGEFTDDDWRASSTRRAFRRAPVSRGTWHRFTPGPTTRTRSCERWSSLDWSRRGQHASPIHSNYPINWLLMYSDLKAFGYNPYAPEFSALIRQRQGQPQLLAHDGADRGLS